MNSDINIVFAANYNYAPHVLTTIKSVCYHNKGVNFYLLHCGFPREWVRNVNRHLEKYDSQLQSLTVNDDLFKGYPSLKHISSESTYYRFLISEAVNADRALYLDCDLVVTGNLREFYYTDFNNNLAIAIPDICLDVLNWHHPYNLHLGKYVNSAYFAKIQQAYTEICKGDKAYINLIVKNPNHSCWLTTQFNYKYAYTLDELADYIVLPKAIVKKQAIAEGRNCWLFDTVRKWAYREVLFYKKNNATENDFFNVVLNRLDSLNIFENAPPLLFNEIKAIAKSISKWTWRHFSEQKFNEIQKARSKKATIKRISSSLELRESLKNEFSHTKSQNIFV
ncbi:glycosyltransferase [Ursidibacter arcticus]